MTVFLILSFFILHSLFLAAPAWAVTCPDGGFVYDPTLPEIWQCCNYQNSPNHIPADTPDCNSTHCQMQNFAKNADSNTYGGACRYCNNLVTVRIDGCSGCGCTCNQVCAAAPPDDDDEEENCHMDDKNLTTCCQLEEMSGLSGTITSIINTIRNLIPDDLLPYIIPTVSLTVNNFKASEDFNKATDYYYGEIKENESGEEEIDPGPLFKLSPPNWQQDEFPDEEDKVETRKKWAKWIVGTSNVSGNPGDDAVNDGKLQHVEPYRLAVESLRNFLVAIPKTEDSASSYKTPKTSLASYPPREVLGATHAEMCNPPVVEAPTKQTCTPTDTGGGPLGLGDLLDLLTGGLELFPKIADLDKIGHYTAGVETDEEGWARDPEKDLHYEDGGFLEIFKIPTEEYLDRNAKGEAADLNLHISIPNPAPLSPPFTFNIPIGSKLLKLRHQGSDTHEREKENGVWAKLTPPETENGTTLLRQDYGGPSAVVLASSQNSLNNSALPSSPLTPSDPSLAEKLGRTLGTWLGKLITL